MTALDADPTNETLQGEYNDLETAFNTLESELWDIDAKIEPL